MRTVRIGTAQFELFEWSGSAYLISQIKYRSINGVFLYGVSIDPYESNLDGVVVSGHELCELNMYGFAVRRGHFPLVKGSLGHVL